jgi:peptidoglycan hydrolase-like protein with peptidoglycan-binding domain
MRNSFRAAVFLLIAFGFSAASMPQHAFAANHHARHHHHAHKKSRGDAQLRTAQTHLIHLGYYAGKADGMMGPKTKKAIKDFQRDQALRVTGTLTRETRETLAATDKLHAAQLKTASRMPATPPPNFYDVHPDFYGHVDQQYADPMMIARMNAEVTQPIPSRYGQLRISQDKSGGAMKRYNVTVNGQPILQVDNQPSVIGISETYELGNEDVIIFSTYNAGDRVCAYKNYLLTVREGGNRLQVIGNCTREYQAHIADSSLFITFPEAGDGRAVAATWRYDNGDLERL